MSRWLGWLACLLIVALDVTAGILGIQAESAQNKEKHMRVWFIECKEPSPEAYKLGAAAVIILCLAHVIANSVGACSVCCTLKGPLSKQCSLACLFLTWVVLAFGLGLLVIGTKSNHKSRTTCGFTHHRYLSFGGILCFVHAGFSVGCYVTATALCC